MRSNLRSRVLRPVLAAGALAAGTLAVTPPHLDAQPVRKAPTAAPKAPPRAPARAEALPSVDLAPGARVPLDPSVVAGRLPNGVRYYLRRNARPERRAALRLVVNAGSVLEDDDQRGLAHFVEHLAFNGTRRFPKNALVDFLERSGVRFGPDLNAYTSFDETVYLLDVPTDTARVLETAVQILADWAGGITFDSAEVVRERGVVLEEWRLGQGAQTRIGNKQRPVIFRGSRYAERLPIGERATIESADVARLRRFYADWYRPDLLTVVGVGDVDPARLRALVEREFGTLTPAASPRPRPSFDVPAHAEPLTTIVTDPEATRSVVSVLYKRPARPTGTAGAERRDLVEALHDMMLNARLGEIAQRPDAPFLGAGAGGGRFVRSTEVYSVGAAVPDGGVARGLEAVLTEVARVRAHGFTATELDRERRNLVRAVEQQYAERDKTPHDAHADRLVEHALVGEPAPAAAWSWAFTRRVAPTITLAEVNAATATLVGEASRVVAAQAPEKTGVAVPSADSLRAVFDRVAAATVAAYADSASDAPLVPTPPRAGRIVAERTRADVGVTEWTLSNGVRVLLRPTDFQADEIRFTAFSKGGHSTVADPDWASASLASFVVPQGGFGTFTSTGLQKRLAGRAVSVNPYVGAYAEGLSGYASPKDVGTLFELIHLTMTAPRLDSAAFRASRQQLESFVANRGASPEQVFGDTVATTMAQHHPRARPFTPALIAELDYGAALRVYRERFADAGDFTFVLVGNFEPAALRPLVERWLASLPAAGRTETWRDVGIRPPTGAVERTVRRGVEPKAQTRLLLTGAFEQTRANRFALSMLGEVLDLRLRERLREALGGTYGVQVGAGSTRIPRPEYTVTVSFGSAPERVDELVRAVEAELDSLRAVGPTEAEVAKVKEIQLRERETQRRQNGFWLSQIAARAENGEDLGDILTYEQLLQGLTPALVREAAQRYLATPNRARFTLLPEAGGAAPAR